MVKLIAPHLDNRKPAENEIYLKKKTKLGLSEFIHRSACILLLYKNKYYKMIIIIFKFEAVVTHSINNTV